MNKQFTASEVRDIAWSLDGLSRQMLRAFADLLEEREKADPVGYISADDIRELDANREDDAECAEAIEMLIASRPFASNHTAIYTHPAPSDAERLAEALRELLGDIDLVKCDFCKCHTWCSVEDSRKSLIKHEAHSAQAQRIHPDVAKAQAIPFDVNDGRPTRSAQAQPPAQSKYAPPYPDQAQDPFWTVPGMVDTRPKTHGTQARPATSVTDANDVYCCKHGVDLRGICDKCYPNEDDLAAQENHNG